MRQILIYKLVIAIAKCQRAKILPIREHIKPPLFDPKWPYWHLASKIERAVMGVSDRIKTYVAPARRLMTGLGRFRNLGPRCLGKIFFT